MARPNLTAVPEGGTTYDELVERGREAQRQADNVQWVEGDLALEVEALKGKDRPRNEQGDFIVGEGALKRYADDIEVTYRTLQTYRQTAEAWPASTRTAASWRVHRELAHVTDRFNHIRDDLTSREAATLAKALMGKGAPAGARKPGWFELAGVVGDDLIAARKHTGTFEAAITRQPNKDLRAKLERYAAIAREVADRLDAVREWRVEEDVA